MSTLKKLKVGRSALGQCTPPSLPCNTGETKLPGSSVKDRQVSLARPVKETSADFLTETVFDLKQTLLDANGALSQMSYGEVLNLSWKDSISLIKAVISFHYEYLLSALQFAPQISDLIQQLIHIQDRVQDLQEGYVQIHICQILIFISSTMNYLFLQIDLHRKELF